MSTVILSGKQAVFVAEYVANELKPEGERLPDYEVALRAGYADRNVRETTSRLMANVNISAAIAERKRQLAQEAAGLLDVDAKRVLQEWAEIATGDVTEIVTVRRVNCRHCWGFAFGYQWTDNEYAMETAKAMELQEDLSRFNGGPGIRYPRPPHPDCPECAGEGVEDVHVKDLRKLTPRQRKLIAGVKQTKFGIEVVFRNQDSALDNLANYLGLAVKRTELTGAGGGPIQSANVNYTLPADPAEAAKTYTALMEGKK